MDVSGEWNSNFDYLLARYDSDGNGELSQTEYARGESNWERLDRDKDGTLSTADFAPRSRGNREERMRPSRVRRLLGWYFQADGTAESVSAEEALQAMALYDTDNDGQLTEAEFTCAYEDRMTALPDDDSRMVKMYMEDVRPWEVLVEELDSDKNATLAAGEFDAFMDRHAQDGMITFVSRESREGGRQSTRRGSAAGREQADRPVDGAAEGSPAPDFTLSSPDGEQTVTLSSFKGSKPVALVFGSYT